MTNDKYRFTLRMPNEMYQQLEREAKSRGISINSQILVILDEYFKKKKQYNNTQPK